MAAARRERIDPEKRQQLEDAKREVAAKWANQKAKEKAQEVLVQEAARVLKERLEETRRALREKERLLLLAREHAEKKKEQIRLLAMKRNGGEVFPLKRLLERPLPSGVDGAHLESYLSEDDFQAAFDMAREGFVNLTPAEQEELKRRAGLV